MTLRKDVRWLGMPAQRRQQVFTKDSLDQDSTYRLNASIKTVQHEGDHLRQLYGNV